MGRFNSSLTRVRPFFKTLLARDPGGSSWLPHLLALAPNRDLFAGTDLLSNPGLLLPTNLDGERKLLPPKRFLRWLIQNPEKMTWPKNGREPFKGAETQQWREKLMGRRDLSNEPLDQHTEIRRADREEAIQKALQEIARRGVARGDKKWWVFEGPTSIDWYLATDRFRVYIEGKRTDILSPSIHWYPIRNQLMRILESAREDADGTPFACLVHSRAQATDNS